MAFEIGKVYKDQAGYDVLLSEHPWVGNGFGTTKAKPGMAFAVRLRDGEPVLGDGARRLSDGKYVPWAAKAEYASHLVPHVSHLVPLTQEWLSASKVCTFEPAEGTAFTHRWDGFEVESDAGHVPSFPMAGKWGMSSGADDYGRTTFRNPLRD